MNNLEKIKAAYAMGYAAKIHVNRNHKNNKEYVVVGIYEKAVICRGINSGTIRRIGFSMDFQFLDLYEITGYLNGGQLCGNEPIPEGQRFRVRKTGELGEFMQMEDERVILNFEVGNYFYSKEEIEPVF